MKKEKSFMKKNLNFQNNNRILNVDKLHLL